MSVIQVSLVVGLFLATDPLLRVFTPPFRDLVKLFLRDFVHTSSHRKGDYKTVITL